ncbi:hypothetical protein K1719_047615 [Acacia pycnantha]|nr:hypothetical protein K1719_047615 [Acacia pycnantha]
MLLVELIHLEQMASEVASRDKSSRPMLRKVTEFTGEDMKVAAGELKEVRKNRKQSLPTWMMFLLFSIWAYNGIASASAVIIMDQNKDLYGELMDLKAAFLFVG